MHSYDTAKNNPIVYSFIKETHYDSSFVPVIGSCRLTAISIVMNFKRNYSFIKILLNIAVECKRNYKN